MARFVLQPCRVREERLVPIKDTAPVVFDWRQLCARLAPSRDPKALAILRLLQVNSYVGLTKHPHTGAPVNFLLTNQDRSGSLARVLVKDPSLIGRLMEVYRVEEVVWDAKLVELPGEGPR